MLFFFKSTFCHLDRDRGAGQGGSKLTDVLNVEVLLVIEVGLIPGAELDAVSCPDGSVVLVEKALVRPVVAVVGTLTPLFGRTVGGSEGRRGGGYNMWSIKTA